MRMYELFEDVTSYSTELDTAISDMLLYLKANNIESISTRQLVKSLNDEGYNVTIQSVISALENNPLVQVATVDSITVATTDSVSASGSLDSKQDNREKVQAMAQKAADKEIK